MILETLSLTKYYDEKLGCRDITISVTEGEIFGFLGPNGAGKSTFIKMLVGLLFPTSGKAYILDKPLGDIQVRRNLGYLPESFKYQEWMSGEELLSFHASLYKLDKHKAKSKIQEVLELVKLKGQEKYRIGTYSKGMQQRIGIASALLCDPKLIILDEPTSALDPIGRKEVRDIMLELKRQNKTIILNSHLLSEVEQVCDSAAIINKGSIIKQGTIGDILGKSHMFTIVLEHINDKIISVLNSSTNSYTINHNNISLTLESKDKLPNIMKAIIDNGGRLYELTPVKENLEQKFIELIEGSSKI